MIGGSRYCDIIRMLWYACIAVCIARDFDVATEQSQKHAKVIFTNEDTKHLKAAEKMKSLSCSGHRFVVDAFVAILILRSKDTKALVASKYVNCYELL